MNSAHPRHAEYLRYRSALSIQEVRSDSFDRWLEQTEQEENGREVVYFVDSVSAKLAPGWYKNRFPPKSRGLCYTFGPFGSKLEAENS